MTRPTPLPNEHEQARLMATDPSSASTFDGLRVVAFESRLAGAMSELISRHGGNPLVVPSLREVPLEDSPEARDFSDRLMAGALDVVIFLTGVGTRALARLMEQRIPRAEWVAALRHCEVVARGPKPTTALRELGARVDLQVPEPNTWVEILEALDTRRNLNHVRVAIQEYGASNPSLIEGLEQRGARVTRVPVYRWELPEDTAPLQNTVEELISGRVGAALFTAARQIANLFAAAGDHADALRDALAGRVIIGSVGPVTSEALREHGIEPDIEPEHPKMGPLVAATAARWRTVAKTTTFASPRSEPSHIAQGPGDERLQQSRFLRACRREPTEATPIWLMRQAGRYMAEYRELRAKVSFLDLCKRPELATEVTVTAARRLGVDAAILFADILLILEPLGFDLEFAKGEGPVIHNPIRTAADVDRVQPLSRIDPLRFVTDAVTRIRAELPPDMPLIGFAGAPFTLACYAIEGGASRHYDQAKAFLYRDPGAWNALMERLVDATIVYLNAQAAAGAQVLQLFDSWVGSLGPDDYRLWVQPHMKRLISGLTPGVPVIHFGTGTAGLLELQRDAGGDVIGLDWRVDLDSTWRRLGPQVAVQGNLDPAVLLGPISEIKRQASRILKQAQGRPGHIFNLGHGILPQTPVDHVLALVDHVHRFEKSAPAGF